MTLFRGKLGRVRPSGRRTRRKAIIRIAQSAHSSAQADRTAPRRTQICRVAYASVLCGETRASEGGALRRRMCPRAPPALQPIGGAQLALFVGRLCIQTAPEPLRWQRSGTGPAAPDRERRVGRQSRGRAEFARNSSHSSHSSHSSVPAGPSRPWSCANTAELAAPSVAYSNLRSQS